MHRILIVGFAVIASLSLESAAFSRDIEQSEGARILFSDPAAALPLLKQDLESNPSIQLEVYIAFARFQIEKESQTSAATLRRKIKQYLKLAPPGTYEIGMILNQFACYELEREDADDARKLSEKAEEILRATAPDDLDSIGRSLILTGISYLIDQPATRGAISSGYESFKRARGMYTSAGESAEMNSKLAESIAWQAAAAGKMATYFRARNEAEPFGDAFVLQGDTGCSKMWAADTYHSIRAKVSWVHHLIEHGVPYGLVLAVDAAADGRPENVRIIAEARRPSLLLDFAANEKHRAEVVRRTMMSWHADMDRAPADCLVDQVLVIAGYSPPEYSRFDLGIQTDPGHHE